MDKQIHNGIERLLNATKYSWQGFKATFKNEQAFRQEIYLAVILVPAGLWLGDSGTEKALLVGVIFIVIIVELINTGIEFVVDRFGEEIHEYSGIAKDVGSAAVLTALANVCVVWTLVLFF